MFRRAAAAFTVIAVLSLAVLSTGCVSVTTSDMKTLPKPAVGSEVLSVLKTNGERVQFAGSRPGHVRETTIEGTAVNVTPARVSIPISDVRQIEYKKNNPTGTALIVVAGVLTGVMVVLGLTGNLFKLDLGGIISKSR